MIRKLSPLFALFLFVGAAGPLAAGDLRFELGFGWTLVAPSLNATYVSQYKPPLVPAELYVDTSIEQTVHFGGKTSFGFNGFFNLFFSEKFGLQLLADYQKPGIGGENPNYTGQAQFLDFNGDVATYEIDTPWPNSAGNLTETVFSLNALARFPVADNLAIGVSAGPTLFNFEGKAGYIGYTEMEVTLGVDEYVLSGMTYQTIVAIEPQSNYGFNLGVEAAYEVMHNVLVALDLRYYGAPSKDIQMHVVEDPILPIPAAEIDEAIGLGSISVNPSFFRAALAIRFVF
jgi:hypothetical protein